MSTTNLPSLEELESKIDARFGKKLIIEVKENIFFRLFGIDLIIPKGFRSDGASIGILKAFLDSYNFKRLFAAIVHDYIYRTQFIPKLIGDAIFYVILKSTASNPTAYIFYKGVDWFGYRAWNNNKHNLQRFPRVKHDLKKKICGN